MSVVEWGIAACPAPGESECGDGAVVHETAERALAAAVDGLGHGHEAALAAGAVLGALREEHASLTAAAAECHRALKGTRGAALTLAAFDSRRDLMAWLGIGNVEGRLLRAGAADGDTASLLLRPGIAGEDPPSQPPSTTTVKRGDMLVLATDGVASSFDRDIRADGSCQEIADDLLHRHAGGSDDALVMVVRYLGGRR